MSKLVVAINGRPTAGKDTFCEYCTIFSDKVSVDSISSVDQIKALAIELGWDSVTKDNKSRKFLSDLKDLSTEFNDGPFCYITNCLHASEADIFFIHIREIEEIDKLKVYCQSNSINFCSLYVDRNVDTVENNTGDIGATLPYPYTYTIDNSGTLVDLQDLAKTFILSYYQCYK